VFDSCLKRDSRTTMSFSGGEATLNADKKFLSFKTDSSSGFDLESGSIAKLEKQKKTKTKITIKFGKTKKKKKCIFIRIDVCGKI
jgi:hypothetical protein